MRTSNTAKPTLCISTGPGSSFEHVSSIHCHANPMKPNEFDSIFGSADGLAFGEPGPRNDLNQMLAAAGEAIAYFDSSLTLQYCNEVYLVRTGKSLHEVIGRVHTEEEGDNKSSALIACAKECLRSRKHVSRLVYSHSQGRWFGIEALPSEAGVVVFVNHASDEVVRQINLGREALTDELTGLGNYKALIEDADRFFTPNNPACLLIVGLDDFQQVNDSCGTAMGDFALIEIASRFSEFRPDGCKLVRLKGDEFAFLAPLDGPSMYEMANSALQLTRAPITIKGALFSLSASAGYVERSSRDEGIVALIQNASLALQGAKRTKRGGVVKYEPDVRQLSPLHGVTEDDFIRAIECGQLDLFLQPKGSLSDGSVIGAEALIRWLHPQYGVIPGGIIIEHAQRLAIMRRIDAFVLERSIKHVLQLRAVGIDIPISINLSAEALLDLGTPKRILEHLSIAGMPSTSLEIEIPEGTLLKTGSQCDKVIQELSNSGLFISIDDFGSGHSSFSYLMRFPVHAVKLDRVFVSSLIPNSASRKVVRGIINLADSMEITVVAEGAEDAETIAMLQSLGCAAVQGYGYSGPLSFADFVTFYSGGG